MKLATFFMIPAGVISIGDERGLPERYLYEKPLCRAISECAGVQGCDAQTFTAETGQFGLDGYPDRFSCWWEITGAPGSQIKILINQGDGSFGLENQPSCGFDRLHIRSADNKGYGRLCSSKKDDSVLYNGMPAHETYGGEKYKSMRFQQWLLLDTDHLVIGFDADSNKNMAGFQLQYEIVATVAATVAPTTASTTGVTMAASLEAVGDELEQGLDDLVTSHVTSASRRTRLGARVQRLFSRFDLKMSKCRNGDQSGQMHSLSLGGLNSNNLTLVEAAWMQLFSSAFNNCDLPIIRNHGSFEKTSWPTRIKSVISQLGRDL